ncbi:MAG TPA: cyclic nucleotide-binding domain-containing protein [Terriglobales bacterium]|nr:cyclic nucleotide-binding domain-containing protein [Terriglobales bacterium]
MTEALIDTKSLDWLCRAVHFEPGDILRHQGQHYTDMYLLIEGSVAVHRQTKGREELVVADSGSPIGEIGFLRGSSATATVSARTPTFALVLDRSTLARLEDQQPALAAHVLRQLALIADARTSDNLVFDPTASSSTTGIEVLLCLNKEMLESAQRLRYSVYCEELQRQSPYADHAKKIITDTLDQTGHTFLAVEKGETIGTVRVNLSSEGPLGVLEDLYGMRASKYHPQGTGVCTKFIVKKSKRGGPTSLALISAVARYGMRHSIKEAYIDCVPALLPYYRAIGFTRVGDAFLHQENGPSYPMLLNVVKHGKRLSNERGDYFGMFVRAQLFKLIEGGRKTRPVPRRVQGRKS